MSKEWIIKISVEDYLFGYVGGSTALELKEDVKSFLKDHPEGKVLILFNLKFIYFLEIIIMNSDELKERIKKDDIRELDSDSQDSNCD